MSTPFANNSLPGETPAPRKRGRRRWLLIAVAVPVLLAATAAVYLQSSAFRESVRRRLVAALEQATGGRVELREFSVNWPRLEVSLGGLVLHGSEASGQPPLFSADWVVARWRLVSFWRLNADLAEIRVSEPKINITVGEGGRSNLPAAPRASGSGTPWAPRLLALEIGRIEVLRGELRWNLRRVPLDFRAEQVQLHLDFEPPGNRYVGQVSFRNAIQTSAESASLNSEAQARFALYSDHAEIESANWQTGKSRITLHGGVSDFEAPRFEFQYALAADWADLGTLLHARGWVGSIAWQGAGSIGGGPWSLQGDFSARTARNGIPGWSELPWTAGAKLRLAADPTPPDSESKQQSDASPWQATWTGLEINMLGGQLTGSASVHSGPAGPLTNLALEARGLSLPALTRAMTALPVKLDSLPWAGSLSGPLQAHFVGPGRDFGLEADWNLVPQAVVPPGFFPVSGKLNGHYDAASKRLESRNSYVDLPDTHLSANGWFDAQESQMQLAGSTGNLAETEALGEIIRKGFRELPIGLDGRASAEMNWTGGTERARFEGSFEIKQFTYENLPWDSFSGRLDYRAAGPAASSSVAARVSGSVISARGAATLAISSAELKRGAATMNFKTSLALENGGLAERLPFLLQGRVRGASAEELQQMAGVHYPFKGLVDASFDVSGTRLEPTGKGTVSVSQGAIYDESFDRLTADLGLDRGIWSAGSIRIEKGSGSLGGSVSVDPSVRKFQFSLSGTGIPLGSLRSLPHGDIRLAGIAEGNLSGEGTFEKPQVKGQIRIHQLAYGALQTSTLTFNIDSNDERARWTADGDLWGGEVRAQGETTLSGSYPLTADVSFQNLGLAPLVKTVREVPKNLEGCLSGSAHAEGGLRDLKGISVRGRLDSLEASINSLSFHSAGSTEIQYQNRELRLSSLQMQGPQLQFETSGTVRFAQAPELNLNAKGQMNLAALSQADPQLASSGQLQLDAQIGGTTAKPLWHGRLTVSDGSIHYGNFPNGFDRLNGAVVFSGDHGNLEKVTAETGGGQVLLGGFVGYGEGSGWQLNLTGEATAVRIRYPQGMSTWVNGRFSWTGSVHSSLVEGRAVLTRQSISPQFDLVQALLSKKADQGQGAMPEVLRNMRLNVEVTSAADLRLDTLTTRNLQADVELRIQGTVAQPVWLGRIGILGGEILFAGKRYTVNRGEISFVNPLRFEPVLNLSVQARVQRYDITMDFNGPPDRLTVTYRSDPPLQTSDILNLLVAGQAQQTSLVPSNQALPQVGAGALLSQALQSQIGTRLDRLFGTGRVHVDPLVSSLGRATNASVAFEQQISDNLSLLYVTDVTSTQQQTIQAEWDISPKLSVVGIRDQNGLFGVNFQITLRFP